MFPVGPSPIYVSLDSCFRNQVFLHSPLSTFTREFTPQISRIAGLVSHRSRSVDYSSSASLHGFRHIVVLGFIICTMTSKKISSDASLHVDRFPFASESKRRPGVIGNQRRFTSGPRALSVQNKYSRLPDGLQVHAKCVEDAKVRREMEECIVRREMCLNNLQER